MAKRTSGGYDKKILGVPVFPVCKLSSNGDHNNDHNSENGFNSPQPYSPKSFSPRKLIETPQLDTNRNSILNTSTASNQNGAMSNLTQQWKLRHIDFMPSSKGKKEDEYEKFSSLVDRANDWSVKNPHVIVFTCETVTWTSVDRPLYTDTGVMVKSMSRDSRTKCWRGLRLWYFIFEEVFIKTSGSQRGSISEDKGTNTFRLGYVVYTCDAKGETSFSDLLKRLNSDILRRALRGKILRVETLELLSDISDVDTCVWFEQADKSKDYTWFLKVLLAYDPDETNTDEICVYDFIPTQDHKNPHNAGYQTYYELWKRASNFVYQNPNITFLGVQSLFVKVKKDTETKSMTLWDKCTHCQHASSYGGLSNHRTEYLQILRLTYYKSNQITPGRNAHPLATNGKKLFYKSFSPSPMKRAQVNATEESDSMGFESLYEDLTKVEHKINSWLIYSGAKVASIETLTTRLGTGGQEMLSSEATSVYNQRERNLTKEPWKVTIRLVLEGEFREKPLWCECSNGRDSIRSDV